MRIAIVDYGSGNLRSVAKAMERAGRSLDGTVEIEVTSDAEAVLKADRVVLPGVGAFGDCRAGIHALAGMDEALRESVEAEAKPFLGICVGMQLMAEAGLEHGHHKGFGWLKGTVKPLEPKDKSLKIPHMGWNELTLLRPHPALPAGLGSAAAPHTYFVHSYGFADLDEDDLLATTDYGGPVTAMVARDNMMGTQFHPEKSQAFGLALLEGFMRWRP